MPPHAAPLPPAPVNKSSVLHQIAAAAPEPGASERAAVDLSTTWGALLGPPPLGTAQGAALDALVTVRRLGNGASIFGQQTEAHSLHLLHEGRAALGVSTAHHSFQLERSVNAPAWLDQSSAWANPTHALAARCQGECIVAELPLAPLRSLLGSEPALALRMVRSLAQEIQTLATQTHELMHLHAPARLAAWLLRRCPLSLPAAQPLELRLPGRKRELASQLGVTPETLSRLLRSFSHQGVISVAGYTVAVNDLAALRALALAP